MRSAAWIALCALAASAARAEPLDAAARLPVGGAAWEAYELVAVLDQGYRVMARFMITNEGPGEHNAVAFGHVLRPGAAPVAFQNGRREDAWRFAPDGKRVEIGSSLLVLADGATRHFEVDNDKRGVKVFLDWEADPNARAVPGVLKGYAVDLLQLATPVRASIQVGDMPAARVVNGTLALTRSRAAVSEAELLRRRIDVFGVERGSAFYLLDLLGPEGVRSASIAAPTAAGPEFAPSVAVGLEGPTLGSTSYPLARRLTLTASDFSGSVTLGESLLEADPLSALPTFLRMVYSLRGRPHRSWIDARFELSQGVPDRPATRAAGSAIAVLTFLDQLPSTPTHP